MSWLDRLKTGLTKTRDALTGGIRRALGGGAGGPARPAGEVLDDLEALILGSDLGLKLAEEVLAEVRPLLEAGTLDEAGVLAAVKGRVAAAFGKDHGPMRLDPAAPPAVLMMVGVNGVGKTTTVAKLAHRFKAYGRTPILVAGDTFRAGAIEQLKVWGGRIQVPVITGKAGSDPSSLAYDATAKAKSEARDLVIIDTAGRLHTQHNLMKELEKISKTVRKLVPGAPHETFLVVDATTGANAVRQAEEFKKICPLTGLVVTKLDGTAKGGCIVPVVRELGLPVRFLGVGEGLEDLDNFKPQDYVEALFAAD